MSEYKENTVGWHLSRLKEPLRSRALRMPEDRLLAHCISFQDAIELRYEWSLVDTERSSKFEQNLTDDFWQGVRRAIGYPEQRRAFTEAFGEDWADGWYMSKECAPDPEVPTHVEDLSQMEGCSPSPWSEIKAGVPFKMCGSWYVCDDVPTNRSFSWMPHLRAVDPPIEEWGEKIPIGSFDGFLSGMQVVHGYTPPRPVETIEGRHDRELKELQAEVSELRSHIESLRSLVVRSFSTEGNARL